MSYSAVIASVDLEITDQEISDHLISDNITHRFCKRIISKATNNPTYKIRIITACVDSYQRLLQAGVFYKNSHFPVFESRPPPPLPIPCNKCNEFSHSSDKCTAKIQCTKCLGPHNTSKCTSQLPEKCKSCGQEGHSAWSFKCKNRPTAPIKGVPNVRIKSANKRSNQLDNNLTKDTRIHKPITIHDHIIDTYVTKINSPKCLDRQELINSIKRRFIEQYQIDTIVAFSGSFMYVIMIDLEDVSKPSPTEPSHGSQSTILQKQQ